MKILEMTWEEFKEKVEKSKVVIIPSGAIEVYGPQLPLGTDTIVAEEIAKKVADKLDLLVGPTLPVGDSMALYDFPGTLTVRPESFKVYLEDICLSFIKCGIKKFFFINTHLGNVPIIGQISWRLKELHEIQSCQIDWWRFIQPLCKDITKYSGVMAHGHASEAGTSCMLNLKPQLVKKDKYVLAKPLFKDNYPDIIKYFEFHKYSNTGNLGDATVASAEKGKLIVDKSIERIVEYLKKEFNL